MSHSNSFISNSRFQRIDAKKLINRLALFSVPFLLGAIFIAVVDPYDFLNLSKIINEETKFKIAQQLNPCFWKLNKFAHNPNQFVIIGDSRMESMDTEIIRKSQARITLT